ncbi:ABC transporter permease [Spirosoma arcticum]
MGRLTDRERDYAIPRSDGPPRWATWLLSRFSPTGLEDELQGDLLEMYAYWLKTIGVRAARWRYGLAVLRLIRPFTRSIAKRSENYSHPACRTTSTLQPAMIRNYVKVAWRNLVNNKVYSAINIIGLAVGMAVAILNGLWVWDELSFNEYHQHYDRIAKVTQRGPFEGRVYSSAVLPLPLANELKTNYGNQFKHVLLALPVEECILSARETTLAKQGQFIEAGAPDMLSLKMIKGTWSSLSGPNSILLAASTAKALFGDVDPVNQIVKINTNMISKVTGVYEDLPHNSEFYPVKFFAPFDLWASAHPNVKQQGWSNRFLFTYVQLQPKAHFAQVSAQIKDTYLNHIKGLEGLKEQVADRPQIQLLPMSRWHLHGGLFIDDTGPVQLVWMIGLIGVFVLLLACINFMNLSTARSEKRAKEVGIRKAVGSLRGQLIRQFFSESFLVVVVSFILAVSLVALSLSWFNDLAAKEMKMPWSNPYFWLLSVSFIGLTGFVAGIYPALYLSSFQAIKVLKGTFRVGRGATLPRRLLVVMQFTVSVALIIGTITVYRQIQHAKNRPVGYNRESLLLIKKKTAEFSGKYDLIRNELKNTGVVAQVAESKSSVTDINMRNSGFSWKGNEMKFAGGCATLPVTPEYGRTIGWQFVGGRDFSPEFASDSVGFVVNESFAKQVNSKNPVGELVTWAPGWRQSQSYKILGVVKDMVALSPYDPTFPTVFFLDNNYDWINIRLNPRVSASAALPKIEAVFKKLTPNSPFDYQFADQEYALKFAAEERISQLALFFTILAILISCLGLFALASFTAEQRVKEIGVRKVLGATVGNLWVLLSKDFVYLVVGAFLLAAPLSYYVLTNWLRRYEYRTEVSWWIFVIAGLAVLLITLLTVSYQSIKAALLDPVKSLRSE